MVIREIEIPLYIRKVKLSNARRPTYYEFGRKVKIPKKYQDRSKFDFRPYKYSKRTKMILTDLSTGKRVTKNSKSVGTPMWKGINGQDIYNATYDPMTRNKIMWHIKQSFLPYIETMEPIDLDDLPIRVEAEVHYTIKADNGQLWDVDNHFYLYQKAFQDVLQGFKTHDGDARHKAIIPDDNNLCISKPPSPLFIPVRTREERKLVFRIIKESDPRIIENKERIELFNSIYKKDDRNKHEGEDPDVGSTSSRKQTNKANKAKVSKRGRSC
jgi:hypothetical protein